MSKKGNVVYELRSRKVEKSSSSRIQPCKKASKPEKSSEKPSDVDLISKSLSPDLMMSEEEMLEDNRREWMEWAELALEHYTRKEGGSFKLVNVSGLMQTIDVPYRDVHMNFLSTSETEEKYFYAELQVPCKYTDPHLNIQVLGCCVLKKIDSGDPKAQACGMCGHYVRHPSPRYGFAVESGDGLDVLHLGM